MRVYPKDLYVPLDQPEQISLILTLNWCHKFYLQPDKYGYKLFLKMILKKVDWN